MGKLQMSALRVRLEKTINEAALDVEGYRYIPGPETTRCGSPVTFQSLGEIDAFHSSVLSPTFAENSTALSSLVQTSGWG
jgi:hypothetical protein